MDALRTPTKQVPKVIQIAGDEYFLCICEAITFRPDGAIDTVRIVHDKDTVDLRKSTRKFVTAYVHESAFYVKMADNSPEPINEASVRVDEETP